MVCFVRGSRSCTLDRDRTAESTHCATAVCLYPCSYQTRKANLLNLSLIAILYRIRILIPGPKIICRIIDLPSHQTVPGRKFVILTLQVFKICAEADFLLIDFINKKLRV